MPEVTLTPGDEAELAEAVRSASVANRPLEIRGGGSRMKLGRPAQAAATLSTEMLTGVTLYEPGALTLVVKAGTPMAEVEQTLAEEGQQLPFEPMDHRKLLGSSAAEPTIGGVVASAAAGPRRIQAGGCRDSLIGVRFVNGAGEAIKSGGRVMKNVTGYDLPKLMAGAFGTLGVLTEVAFKLLPKPAHTVTLLIEGLSDETAIAALCSALGSPYDVTGAAHLPIGVAGAPVTMIRLEGFAESARYRAEKLREALAHVGGSASIEEDPAKTEAGWAAIRDCEPFAARGGAVWRVSVRPTDGPVLAQRLAAEIALDGHYYDWGGGLVWLLTPDQGDAGAAEIHAEATRLGGSATLVRAGDATRAAVPVFAERPEPVRALERGLKAAFDPAGILNPGRMG